MTTIRVIESKAIRRPIDIVRSHYSDIRHHMVHNVHPSYPVEIVAENDGGCTYNLHSKLFGRNIVDVYVVERRVDGSVFHKVVAGPGAGSEQVIVFRTLTDGATEVSVTLTAPLKGLGTLLAPLLRRHISQELKKTLEEDRVDMEVKGYQPMAARSVA